MLNFSASLITSATGHGEVHVNHGGVLNGYEAELKKLANGMGGTHVSLGEEFWVLHSPALINTSVLCKELKKLVRDSK